jgi:Phage tail protein/Carbohydrate binding domain
MARNNLIVNPSFKTNTTGWSVTGSSTLTRITSDYFYGSSCLQVAKAAASNSGAVTSSRILVTQLLSYALGVYVKIAATEEPGTLVARVQWYDSATAGSLISTSNTISLVVIPGDDWVRLTGVFTAPSTALSALISIVQPTAGTAAETFYVDAVLFEQAEYLNEYIDEPTQAQETKKVDKGLSPVPYPKITGLKLDAGISLGSLILNTIDENGVVWVCTDIEGWWNHPEPDIDDIPRGYGDGSYDVRGRYQARQLTLNGVFLVPDASYVAAARSKLIENTDLVYTGNWLITNENPPKASYVRLSGRPEINTVNPRGRTEFSIGLRAPDPLKYEWFAGNELGYRSVVIPGQSASPVVTGQGSVVNTGNAYAPVVLEITGPLTGPGVIQNVTTNEEITIIESLRGVLTPAVSNKALTSNVATLTTSSEHNLLAGDEIVVTGVDSTFNGTYTVLTVPTTVTLTYAKTAANVVSAAVSPTGTITFGPDILEIDTRDHEVALNGDAIGKRNLIDVLAEWTLLSPGTNIFSFVDEGAANATASLTVYYRSAWLG